MPPRADDDNARASLRPRCIRDRADARHHRAAQCCQRLERHIFGYRYRAFFGHDCKISETGGAVVSRHLLPARIAAACRPQAFDCGKSSCSGRSQSHRTAFQTIWTTAARRRPAENDVIAHAHPRHAPRPLRARYPRLRARAQAADALANRPRAGCKSLWHTPAAFTSTSTSPARGASSSVSSTESGWPSSPQK